MPTKPTARARKARKPKAKHVGHALIAMAAKARAKAPAGTWEQLPKDWSNVDKYLYGRKD